MFKEMLVFRSLSGKLKNAGIGSVKELLDRCQDPQSAEKLRIDLDVNVTPEQWLGAVAVIKELFK